MQKNQWKTLFLILPVFFFFSGQLCLADNDTNLLQNGDNPVTNYRQAGTNGSNFGFGMGIFTKSSPYRGVKNGIVRIVPSIFYISERVRLFGPFFEYKVGSYGYITAVLTARYRFDSYDVKDSRFFEGLDSPEDTLMSGVGVQIKLPSKMSLSVRCEADVLDKTGGYETRIHLKKRMRWKMLSITPELGINVLSSELANHDYGVPEALTLDWRPAYHLDEGIVWDTGISITSVPFHGWTVNISGNIEILGDEIRNSPLVDKDIIARGMLIVSRML